MRAAGKQGHSLFREKAVEGGREYPGREERGIEHSCSAFCDALFGFRKQERAGWGGHGRT